MDDISNKIEKRFENVSRSKTFANILKTFDLGNKSVLDLGCSYGEFLKHFGPGSVGLTISEYELEQGKKRGVDIRLGNIESDQVVLEEKFEVIFANNLFEHLLSPHDFLCKIKNYLKPEGVLILGVPCFPKILPLLRLSKWNGSLATAHINFFTRETLVETVKRAGWHISEVRGFRFFGELADHFFDPIYPHFYVIATVDPDFTYSSSRLKELEGYNRK